MDQSELLQETFIVRGAEIDFLYQYKLAQKLLTDIMFRVISEDYRSL
jgi:hypothetical protein